MPADPKDGYAYIENTTEEECRDKWDGNDWTPDTEGSETGICESNFDFDAWAEEYEGE